MTFQESVPIAKELAENELKKHFDVDAFILLALIDKMNIDLVPESNVDETITDIQSLFVSYMRNRTKENLEILLSTIRKMLSELYMTCNLEEKEIFKKHLETLQNITQPNII
nr:MAG TPA: hypothetical protein [Caudoviricetes sp.]